MCKRRANSLVWSLHELKWTKLEQQKPWESRWSANRPKGIVSLCHWYTSGSVRRFILLGPLLSPGC